MKIDTHLNNEKSSKIIINVVEAIHQANKITDQTIMTIKTLGNYTEIIIRQSNYRNNSYRDSNRQNSRDRQINGLPRSDNRYRDRSRDHDRVRTHTRQNNNTHSRDSSGGRSPQVHFTSETPRGYYNNENHNDGYLN